MDPSFKTLVIHFFKRFFESEGSSDEGGTRTRFIQLLAILTVPGVLISFLLMPDHPPGSFLMTGAATESARRWLRVGDRYAFVCYAMTVMGLVMAYKWDALFPDRRDYLILTPLPISAKRIFAAKTVSLAALLSLFAIAINLFPLLIVPLTPPDSSMYKFAAHLLGTLGGSLFMGLTIAALQGVLINVLSPHIFRRISPWIQMVVISASTSVLLITPLLKDSLEALSKADWPIVNYLPTLWFLGLYESIMGDRLVPTAHLWGNEALIATAVAAAVCAATYAIGYQRYSKKILEASESDTVASHSWQSFAAGVLNRTILKSPVQRATFHFTSKIAGRSSTHRIMTALYTGAGAALALSSLFVVDHHAAFPFKLSLMGVLEAPIILSFLTISGLRATFNVPYEIGANWIFQITGGTDNAEYLNGIRKWAFLQRILPLYLLIGVFEFSHFGIFTASAHLMFDLIISSLLFEAFFLHFNKVPFTCSLPAQTYQLVVVVAAYLWAFGTYVDITGNLKWWATSAPAPLALFLISLGAVFAVASVVRRLKRRRKTRIVYDEAEAGALSISGDHGYWTAFETLREHAAKPRSRETDLEDEIRSHIEMSVVDRMDRGESHKDAHAAALREFGNVAQVKETTRSKWGWVRSFLDRLRQDVGFGVRMLRKSPSFTIVAIVSLALGIGANTAIFAIVNSVFLRPIPVADPSTLYVLGTTDPMLKRSVLGWNGLSLPNFQDLRNQADVFSGMAASTVTAFSLRDGDATARLVGESVTSNYFDILGIKPAIGRTFVSGDDPLHGINAAVLSYRVWTDQFGSDPETLGRQVLLNSVPFVVVGVAQQDFKGPKLIGGVDQVWVSIGSGQTIVASQGFAPQILNRRSTDWYVFARLRPGVSPTQTTAELKAIGERLAKEFPAENAGRGIRWTTFSSFAHATFSGAILPVFAGMAGTIVGLILVIVCINIANLQLARSSSRRREISIRMALGGSRARIVRQLVTESVILSTVGGMAAFLVLYWVVAWFNPLIRQSLGAVELRIDGHVLFFVGAVSVLSGVLFGLAPALRLAKPDIQTMLQSGGGGSSMTSNRNWLTRVLVVCQVALSLAIVVCAGFFVRLIQKAENMDPGYNYSRVASVRFDLAKAKYRPEQGRQFYHDALERLRALPGVEAAVVSGSGEGVSVFSADDEHFPNYVPTSAVNTPVSTDFFSGLGETMLAGRSFSDVAEAGQPTVAIITHAMGEHLWPGGDPVGQRFHFGGETQMREVIGVVSDPTYTQVVPLYVYTPIDQVYAPSGSVLIRVSDDPSIHLRQFRDSVQAIDANVTIVSVQTMRDIMRSELLVVAIVGAPVQLGALLALGLAVIGIYGVTAYSLSQRTQEIGIRMALGARRNQILLVALGDGARLALLGVIIGLGVSRAVAPTLSKLLPSTFNVTDPWAFLGAAIVLIAVTMIACYIPARRATRVDPLVALRHE